MIKHIQLINDDYLGHVDILRHASRGVLVMDDKILIGYAENGGIIMIPGGGVEGDETYAECCVREMLEETGMKVNAVNEYLEIEELFDVWRHINHYFICELVEDTGVTHFTEAEIEAGYKPVWLPIKDALAIFAEYEKYRKTDIPVYGLYKRELIALEEALSILQK